MTKIRQASLAVRRAVKAGKITTEQEARRIARKFLRGAMSYEITGAITDELPKTIAEIISKTSYRHPWFQRKVNRTVFKDIWGRIWNRTTGTVKPSVKLDALPKRLGGEIWIDELGGMSWQSKDKKHFVCEFRTSLEEFNRGGVSPETFIG